MLISLPVSFLKEMNEESERERGSMSIILSRREEGGQNKHY